MADTGIGNIAKSTHHTWHKFYKWVTNTFGKDLYEPWIINTIVNPNGGKPIKIKYRNLNEYKLSQRLAGYEVICKVKKYIKRCCPEIKIVCCDDSLHAGSIILLIPHPAHGITMMFIPQCTGIQNQLFLYGGHYKQLMNTLRDMEYVYEEDDDYTD